MLPPDAIAPEKVGTYPARTKAGGGYVWDAVLEYRVWCHSNDGDSDYFYPFATFDEASQFAQQTPDAEQPLALILQEEFIDEQEPGSYVHAVGPRMTEWPVKFLSRPKRTPTTIPAFLAHDAPANRLEILRGTA